MQEKYWSARQEQRAWWVRQRKKKREKEGQQK
jgi:hypothetical protein